MFGWISPPDGKVRREEGYSWSIVLAIPTTPRHQIDDEFALSKALKCRYSNTCGDEADVIKLRRFDEMLDTQWANMVGRLASHSKSGKDYEASVNSI